MKIQKVPLARLGRAQRRSEDNSREICLEAEPSHFSEVEFGNTR